MKKIIITIISIVAAISIGIVIYCSIRSITTNDCIQISTGDMMSKIENHQTFTVYFYQQGCGSCVEVSGVIKSYIKNTGADIYMIDLNNTDYKNYLANSLNIQGSPTVIRFVNGMEKARLTSTFTYEDLKECIE